MITGELFNLVGPTVHELTFPEARAGQWIANARYIRVNIPLSGKSRTAYTDSEGRAAQRTIAMHNPRKVRAVRRILDRHAGRPTIIIGHFLESLFALKKAFPDIPIITGETPDEERAVLYERFRSGEIHCIIVSSVADRALDFPEAEILIQLNGHFGSRAQEAQRLGRILRPKPAMAYFYSLVTVGTPEEEDAEKRAAYLAARGYRLESVSDDSLAA